MNRIIINNKTDLADDVALRLVGKVVKNGLISETKKGKQYCFLSVFDVDFLTTIRKIHVVCDKTKYGFSFQIYDERKWQPVPWSKK